MQYTPEMRALEAIVAAIRTANAAIATAISGIYAPGITPTIANALYPALEGAEDAMGAVDAACLALGLTPHAPAVPGAAEELAAALALGDRGQALLP
jgi:hypothetical protein